MSSIIMSLPPSPPPPRSCSQASVGRKPTTYNPDERIITPISPTSTRKAKPTLTLNPAALPCQKPTFLASPTPTPSTAASSSLRSFFSPCSDSEDDSDAESDAGPTPIKSAKPRGHFQRLWASRDPPSLPPTSPPPPPRRISIPPSPTFGWHTSISTPPFIFSPGPNTPAFSPRRPPRARPPPAPSAPQTGIYPPSSPWGDSAYTSPTDPLLQNLQVLLASQMQAVSGILAAPPAELVIARAERDRLVVKAQKAYFRREAVGAVSTELAEMERRVQDLERDMVKGFLSAMEGVVGGVREGCKGLMGEVEIEEMVEVEEEKEEEEVVFSSAREWPEVEEVPAPPANEERRFIWIPSSLDEDEDDSASQSSSTSSDPTADPSFAPLPALSPDEELYLSEYTLSPSPSSCTSSPVVGVGCSCAEQCDCDFWSSFLPPLPAMSAGSQRFVGAGGKAVEKVREWQMGLGEENVVVVQGVEMRMI